MRAIKTEPELTIDCNEFAHNLKYPSTLFHICDLYKLYLHVLKVEDIDKYNQYFIGLMKIKEIEVFECIMNNKDNIYISLYDKYDQIDLIIEIIKYLKTQTIEEDMLQSISEYDVSEMEELLEKLTPKKQQQQKPQNDEIDGEDDKEKDIMKGEGKEKIEEDDESILSKLQSMEVSRILQVMNVLFTRNHEFIIPTYLLLFIADINSDVNLVEKYFFVKDIVHMVPKKCQMILANLIDLVYYYILL